MNKLKRPIFPKAQKVLSIFGENIRLARLRREFSTKQISERAGIGESTLLKIEKGDDSVAMGSYFKVLFVLGLHEDFLLVGKDDELGRKLQDIGITLKERAPKRVTKS